MITFFNEGTMDWSSVFSTVTAAAASTASVGFIAKLFANTLATRAIKKFDLVNSITLEAEKAKYQQELEEIKLQLSKLQKEHEIVFSSLYIKRQDAIISLYKLMSNYIIAAKSKKNNKTDQIMEHFNDLENHFNNHRLYFPENVANKINHVISIAHKLSTQQPGNTYELLMSDLKIQVYDQMESIFRELIKTESYR